MTALPVASQGGITTWASRGTVGAQTDNTTQRVEQARMIGYIVKDLRFFNPKWCTEAVVPEKQTELVHWDIGEPATGAVWLIDEFGKQATGTNSLGVAQTPGAEVQGIQLNMRTVQGSPQRYGSVMYWTARAKSVSKRDPVKWGMQEMGLIVAEQLDALARGNWDQFAQDLYPALNVTSDADTEFTAAMTFTYALCIKIEHYLLQNGLNPPEGMDSYPVIGPIDMMSNLLLDTTTATLLRETTARGTPFAGVFLKGFMGQIRSLTFWSSNRLGDRVAGNLHAGGFYFGRAYIICRDALGVISMTDPEYGKLPSADNSSSQFAGDRGYAQDEMPRPVQLFTHEPGSGALGPDLYRDKGATAEKHTVGFKILKAGHLIRVTFALGASGEIGLGRPGVATGAS